MLEKKIRLRKNEEMMRVFRFGKPFFVDSLGCKVLGLEGDGIRIGFSVSKKLFPKAVERNRVKRVLRHAVRVNMDIFPKGRYFVFFFVKKPEKVEYSRIVQDIHTLLEKIK